MDDAKKQAIKTHVTIDGNESLDAERTGGRLMGYTITKEDNRYYRLDLPNGTEWRYFNTAEEAERWGMETYWRDQSRRRVKDKSIKWFSGRQYKTLECGHIVRSESNASTVFCPHCYRQMALGKTTRQTADKTAVCKDDLA